MYYRQFWKDPRLAFPNSNLDKMIITDLETIDRVWQPNTFILNEKKVGVELVPMVPIPKGLLEYTRM